MAKPILIVQIPFKTHDEDLPAQMDKKLTEKFKDYHVIVIGSHNYDFEIINFKILQPS
jgi:hypothetical protein